MDESTETFLRLLMEHRHRIIAFLAKQLVTPADVEDVFQKTSLVLWKKMSDFDVEGSFFHWACGIAFNEVRTFLTTQRRSKMQFDSDLVELLAHEAEEEGDLSEARREALDECINKLPAHQQSILQQCYSDDRSITDIASDLGRNRGALYKQLARLREVLRACVRSQLAQQRAP